LPPTPPVAYLCLVRRMSRPHALALAVAVALSGCHRDVTIPETSREAEPLRWLDHADVITDFTERVERQHDLRFASVYALSTAGAVGLDDTPEMQKLVKQHGERHLEGTTDIISSAEQQRLLHKAKDYVKQYNILLLHYLRGHPNT
jgi:hypothetical protein